ncbi:MAG: putative manganese-dependent inorganic diphosphatase [Anaerovoracaceae bacterium]|jgi:manganese-dependent inorganic pyrophosphatase
MAEERKIIIVGHKNPDTDSICSAIAYADIRNRITNSHRYVPMRAGEVSSETRYALRRFNVPVPNYIGDVGSQVCDMEIRRTPGVSRDITIQKAWDIMGENEAVTLPITEDGKVIGLITKGDIAEAFMDSEDSTFLSETKPRYADIAETVEGEILMGHGEEHFDHGKVLIGAAHVKHMQSAIEPGDLVILVDRSENQIGAIEKGAGCLILCFGAEASDEVLKLAEENNVVLIRTELDTFSVSRAINKSIPIGSLMMTENIISFRTDDYTDKVRAVMSKTRHRAFPVIDDNDNYVGTVSRRNLLGIQKKQIILVDHNEKSQAVDNIDDADILEIIDHHRLGTLQTLQPIYFTNQPVGCTATIIYQMYIEKGIEVSPSIAGLLCSAIISDTLLFHSPTCTTSDKMAAGALALIADIDLEGFATEMFEAGSDLSNKSSEELFYQDYKKFTFGGTSFGVGQISSMSTDELASIKERILPLLSHECGKNGVSMVFFLLTSIRNSSSELLCYGDRADEIVESAFRGAEKTDGGYLLEGLLSRKKQLIPAFMKVITNDA